LRKLALNRWGFNFSHQFNVIIIVSDGLVVDENDNAFIIFQIKYHYQLFIISVIIIKSSNIKLIIIVVFQLQVYPVFVLDPFFANPDYVGVNRYSFLLQSLDDLDHSLRKLGSRLYVVLGKPLEQLPRLVGLWRVSLLTFESDIEPFALKRDDEVTTALQAVGVQVSQHTSHTLFPPQKYVQANGGSAPNVYGGVETSL
jgi:hypothetical protein